MTQYNDDFDEVESGRIAFDFRGIELENSNEFTNDYLGFKRFKEWIQSIKKQPIKLNY